VARSATSARARWSLCARNAASVNVRWIRSALGQATSATVRDVVHACQPTNAGYIVLTDEGEQCFTKRSNKCFFRDGQRGAGCLIMQKCFKQLSGGGCAPRCRECHHSMHDVKRSRTCERLRLPVISQILPA